VTDLLELGANSVQTLNTVILVATEDEGYEGNTGLPNLSTGSGWHSCYWRTYICIRYIPYICMLYIHAFYYIAIRDCWMLIALGIGAIVWALLFWVGERNARQSKTKSESGKPDVGA